MEEQFKQVASLIGDPSRATILWALLDGKAYTATELAMAADTSPQNISMHVSKLAQAGLLSVEKQGRHRYYRFAKPEVAYAIEAMANITTPASVTGQPLTENHSAIRHCRTCYDHLAGKAGVSITDALLKQKMLVAGTQAFEVSKRGVHWLTGMGIDIAPLQAQRRAFARPCLDWSERRHHIAGSLGAALLNMMLAKDWLRRTSHSRAVIITAKGQKALHEHFKISL